MAKAVAKKKVVEKQELTEEKKIDLSRIEQVKRMLEQAMNAPNPRILLGVWHVTDADVVCSEIATINFPRGDFAFAMKSFQGYIASEIGSQTPEPLPPADLDAIGGRLGYMQKIIQKATDDVNPVPNG